MQRRLQLTEEAGLPRPRLEMLCERLKLDAFEKKVRARAGCCVGVFFLQPFLYLT